MACITCEIIMPFQTVAADYGMSLQRIIAVHALQLFKSFTGAWFVWQVIIHGLVKADLNIYKAIKDFSILLVILFGLKQYSYYWAWINQAFNQSIYDLLVIIFKSSSNKISSTGSLVDILETVDVVQYKIQNLAKFFVKESGILNILPLIAGVLLLIPYLMLWIMFVLYFIEYIVVTTTVHIISPVLIALSIFETIRPFSIRGMGAFLKPTIALIIGIIHIKLTFLLIEKYTNELPIESNFFKLDAKSWLLGGSYWSCVVVGWTGAISQLRIKSMANFFVEPLSKRVKQ